MEIFIVIIGALLLIASIIDLYVRRIPSVFLTAILFAVAFLNPLNFWLGAMGFIMAYLLYELDFFSGVADIKIMTMIAFMISSINYFFLFVILIMSFGFLWKVFIKWRMPDKDEIAFVPVFFFVYITMFLLGGIK